MKYRYDIALSYAKENEELVDAVYHYLKAENITAFLPRPQKRKLSLAGKISARSFTGYSE